MKLYGYKDEGLPIEDVEPAELAEITLVATPDELRKIAEFLQSAAQSMERMGDAYDHDKKPGFADSPHLVVFNADRGAR
jgi:phosphopantothenoylcysteine synthetase/decarboxylase